MALLSLLGPTEMKACKTIDAVKSLGSAETAVNATCGCWSYATARVL
jgi:hypothetical protein